MAEGGKVVDSECFYEFNCTVCIRDKSAYAEAAFYCPQCNEYFCKQCLFQKGCDHDHLGRGNVARWGAPSTRHQFDECPRHRGNTLQLYCPKEDVVCCYVCGQSRHKTCGDLKYVPVVASGCGCGSKKSLNTAERELQQLKIKVEQLLKDRTENLSDVDKMHARIKSEIREVKQKIISFLDNLEKASLNELNKLQIHHNDKIKLDLLFLNNTKADMLELLSKLRKPNIDEALLFSRLKQSKELIQDKKRSISDIAYTRLSEKVRFVADTKLLECIERLQGLGVINIDTHVQQHTKGVEKGSKRAQGQGHSSLKLNQPYKVGQPTSCNVNIKEDRATCNIGGMCQLSDGSIIVADNVLKQLDSTYKVTRHCPLSTCPYDVCSTEEGEVAVTLDNKTIQFVSVGDKLTATCSFSTEQACHNLSYHNKCLYVISKCYSTVYVYKPSGSLLHTISTDQHGTQLFFNTWDITVSPVSERLYVADSTKGLVTLDLQGNLLATFKPHALSQGAGAVCVDGAGNVFVREFNSNNILQVSKEGDRKLARIVSHSDGISTGRLCFDNVNTRLLVASNTFSDTVTVLQLAQ